MFNNGSEKKASDKVNQKANPKESRRASIVVSQGVSLLAFFLIFLWLNGCSGSKDYSSLESEHINNNSQGASSSSSSKSALERNVSSYSAQDYAELTCNTVSSENWPCTIALNDGRDLFCNEAGECSFLSQENGFAGWSTLNCTFQSNLNVDSCTFYTEKQICGCTVDTCGCLNQPVENDMNTEWNKNLCHFTYSQYEPCSYYYPGGSMHCSSGLCGGGSSSSSSGGIL